MICHGDEVAVLDPMGWEITRGMVTDVGLHTDPDSRIRIRGGNKKRYILRREHVRYISDGWRYREEE